MTFFYEKERAVLWQQRPLILADLSQLKRCLWGCELRFDLSGSLRAPQTRRTTLPFEDALTLSKVGRIGRMFCTHVLKGS